VGKQGKKHERTIRDRWVYRGFGFPLTLRHVPLVKIRGAWTPDVNYEQLQNALLLALAAKDSSLTGAEVRFIRHAFGMTLQAFAGRFGVTHPAVHKWEKRDGRPTGMAWTTEKVIRLLVASRLESKPERFLRIYRKLDCRPKGKPSPLKLDLSSVA
jgi:DNA-binding transcriptional regulator YiaG